MRSSHAPRRRSLHFQALWISLRSDGRAQGRSPKSGIVMHHPPSFRKTNVQEKLALPSDVGRSHVVRVKRGDSNITILTLARLASVKDWVFPAPAPRILWRGLPKRRWCVDSEFRTSAANRPVRRELKGDAVRVPPRWRLPSKSPLS